MSEQAFIPNIYGGRRDGQTVGPVPNGTERIKVTGTLHLLAEPIRNPAQWKNVSDLPGDRYVLSGPWSEHFQKPTFVPEGFPGRPAHFAA